MSANVTVLGSSGTYSGPYNACSGYLLRTGTTSVLMDAGPGTLSKLGELIPIESLDGIVVSHEHPDHWLELPVLRNAYKYVLGAVQVPLFSTQAVLAELSNLTRQTLDDTFPSTRITSGDSFQIGDLTFTTSVTDHPVETLAMYVRQVDNNAASTDPEPTHSGLIYSADTGPNWSPSAFGVAPQVLICEATFFDGEAPENPVHLTALQAGQAASDCDALSLVVTHVLPDNNPQRAVDEAALAYGGPITSAEPGQVISFT